MNYVTCTKCKRYLPAYDGRVDCMECKKEQNKKWHIKNYAKRLQYLKDYYYRNKANA